MEKSSPCKCSLVTDIYVSDIRVTSSFYASLSLLATGGTLLDRCHNIILQSCLININDWFQVAINWPVALRITKKSLWSHHCTGSCDAPRTKLTASWWFYETGPLIGWQQGSALGLRSSAGKWTSMHLAAGVLRPEQFWAIDKARLLTWQHVGRLAQEDGWPCSKVAYQPWTSWKAV